MTQIFRRRPDRARCARPVRAPSTRHNEGLAGKIAVVRRRHRDGRELVRQSQRGLRCRNVRRLRAQHGGDEILCEQPQGTRLTSSWPNVSDEAQVQRFRTTSRERYDKSTCCSTTRHRCGGSMIARNARSGEDVNVCWAAFITNTRVSCTMMLRADEATSSTPAASTASGLGRTANAAHGLLGGEVRGERLFRSLDRRPADQRAAHQGFRCHAGHIGTSIAANSRKIQAGNETMK